MKVIVKNIFKYICFLTILIVILFNINRVLTDKMIGNSIYSTPVSRYRGFYQMQENTVDVFFLGSSHTYCSFIPQELYDSFGIRSYNLGSSQQSLALSYFWLEEALKYQKPKVVVMDSYMVLARSGDEQSVRRALDYMNWSKIKIHAVDFVCLNNEEYTRSSFYFPNIRYHDRWKNLSENDFSYDKLRSNYQLKGYVPLNLKCAQSTYEPFKKGSSDDFFQFDPVILEQMDKIVQLCKENDIELIFVKTPTTAWNIGKYNAMNQYTASKDLLYFDFNEESIYKSIGYNFVEDNQDIGHPNVSGASKISNYLGEILTNQCETGGMVDDQWEETKEFYQDVKKDIFLKDVLDIGIYLSLIKDDRYTIFMCSKDGLTDCLPDNMNKQLQDLGITINLKDVGKSNYYAIISDGNVIGETSDMALEKKGTLRKGRSQYAVKCADKCSVIIDGKEYSKNVKGINIVVYNNYTKSVVDSVGFDIETQEAIR